MLLMTAGRLQYVKDKGFTCIHGIVQIESTESMLQLKTQLEVKWCVNWKCPLRIPCFRAGASGYRPGGRAPLQFPHFSL